MLRKGFVNIKIVLGKYRPAGKSLWLKILSGTEYPADRFEEKDFTDHEENT